MIQHVTDEERSAVLRQLGDVFPHRIVERQLSFARQQQHGGSGELLRHGSRFEDRVRHDRHIVLEIGHPVAFRERRLAICRDADRTTRRGRRPLSKYVIDLRFDIAPILREQADSEGGGGGD